MIKTMKRFILVSLMLLTMIESASACAWEGNCHNNYLFSIFRREMMEDVFEKRVNQFWKDYTGGKYENYLWYNDEIREVARQKGDKELLAYMDQLDVYLDVCLAMKETWEYPTQEELANRKARILTMTSTARSYKGTRLQPQYQLLQMRGNMLLGNHQANKTFWEKNENSIKPSIYRDMMRNIYAGALLHLGERQRACDIFADQGDMTSIRWSVRHFRNLAGIISFYNENPNSNALIYLVQDFVNNAQETIDNGEDATDWLNLIGSRLIIKAEVFAFIDFANRVVSEKKTDYPSMWKAAAGTLYYLYKKPDMAEKYLAEAMQLDGTPRMKDNARAIHLVAKAAAGTIDNEWSTWMAEEITWLDNKIKEERGNNESWNNHYADVKERLTHQVLYNKYRQNEMDEAALASLAMINEDYLYFSQSNPRSPKYDSELSGWNPDYSSEYVTHLDSLSAIQLIEYYDYLKEKHDSPLERYFVERAYSSDDYFNDMIGTHYMAEGKLELALPYLEKVSLKFLSTQNIGYYMANRDYTKAKWFDNQRSENAEEGPGLASFSSNPKVEFCKNVLSLESSYRLANDGSKAEIAYELAKRYYQASYFGDCWYLTHYSWSCYDTPLAREKDFVGKAIEYLQAAKMTENVNIKQNSLFALAFIPLDPWAEVSYDWQTEEYIYKPRTESRQYKALQELASFVNANRSKIDPYISHCDVLKRFM